MTAVQVAREPRPPAYGAPVLAALGSAAALDSRALALFDHAALRAQIRKLDKLELASVWRLTQQVLARKTAARPDVRADGVGTIEVHRRLLEGLPGESLLVASSMFLASLAEAEGYFGLSFKTLKSRLGGTLSTTESERALRAARAVLAAADMLGSFDAARAWLHSRNYALGGATPVALLQTAEGERIVLDELQAQAEGAPL